MKYDMDDLLRESMSKDIKPSLELNQSVLQRDREEYGMISSHNGKHSRKFKIAKVAVAAMAGLVITSGVAYAATQLWNEDVASKFGVADDNGGMQELKDKGFADVPESTDSQIASVTSKGIEVIALQTLADKKSAYLYLEVDYGDEYAAVTHGATADSDTWVAYPDIDITSSKDQNLSWSGGAAQVKDAHTVTYEYYVMAQDSDFSNCDINIDISKFTVDNVKADTTPDVLIKGDWNLKWKISSGAEKRIYHINKTLKVKGKEVTINRLEITPLSYTLYLDGEEKDTKEDAPVVSKIYLGEDEFTGMGGMSIVSSIEDTGTFSEILDVNKLTGFKYGDKKIDITDCEYETVDSLDGQ